ncbi:MAG: hypothetical protein AAF074_21375 [Pseudomonadota bacterium]
MSAETTEDATVRPGIPPSAPIGAKLSDMIDKALNGLRGVLPKGGKAQAAGGRASGKASAQTAAPAKAAERPPVGTARLTEMLATSRFSLATLAMSAAVIWAIIAFNYWR